MRNRAPDPQPTQAPHRAMDGFGIAGGPKGAARFKAYFQGFVANYRESTRAAMEGYAVLAWKTANYRGRERCLAIQSAGQAAIQYRKRNSAKVFPLRIVAVPRRLPWLCRTDLIMQT